MLILKIIGLFAATFLITFLLVPLNIKFSRKYNLIDVPNERTVHKKALPLAGGLSIAVSVIGFQMIFYLYFRIPIILNILIGNTLILVLGYLDDLKKFTANHKLLFQILISSIVWILGLKIEILTNPFGPDILLGLFSYPVTIIWFILVMNAFNLIDGIDGLASGIAIIVSLVLLTVALMFSNRITIYLTIALIGSNLAFLRYNFYPARIFLGDTGSLFVGFNIAAISIAVSIQFKGITTMTLLVPIIALVIPISDTAYAIFRRIKQRRNIFQADKDHLHHILLNSGFSQKIISIIGYTITFLFGLIAVGFSFASKEILLVILFVLIIILLIFLLFKKGEL